MNGIFTIAGRELRALFYSPAAWVTLAVVQAILAYLFLTQLEFYEANRAQLMRMQERDPGFSSRRPHARHASRHCSMLDRESRRQIRALYRDDYEWLPRIVGGGFEGCGELG